MKCVRQKFAPAGLVAMAATAYGQAYDYSEPAAAVVPDATPTVALLSIRGPMNHHRTYAVHETLGWIIETESYESIECRAHWAFASSASAVVLDIDSPGGLVAGCFELSNKLFELSKSSGKPLYVYVNGACCSAAYALASAAQYIVASESSTVGSIGVIEGVIDATLADAKLGLNVALVTSGPRKADGNPHNTLSADTLEAVQRRVDDTAISFFALVARNRSMSAEAVAALNADSFMGVRAQANGLTDQVGTLDTLLAAIATGKQLGASKMADKSDEKDKDEGEKKEDSTMLSLVADLNSGDETKASRARKMLATLGEEPPGDDDDADKKKKDADAKAQATPAAASAVAPELSARLEALEQTQKADRLQKRTEERRSLLAARPDLSPAQLAVFSDPKLTSLETLRVILPTIAQPTGASATAAQAAQQAAKPVQAPVDGAPVPDMKAIRDGGHTLHDLDVRMGLAQKEAKTEWQGSRFCLPTMTPAQARAAIAAKGNAQ